MAVFLFFDESGNFDFSPSGTRFLVFGVLSTRDPSRLLQPLSDLRYRLIAGGSEIERFHATEDSQVVRDEVFAILKTVGGCEFDAVVVEKRKVHPYLYDVTQFYPKFADYLLRYVFGRYADPKERIVIVTDSLPVRKKRGAVIKAFKGYMRRHLGGRPFTVLHHPSASHMCLQAADYCTWAIYKKWKDAEMRPYTEIAGLVRSDFDILRRGTEHFY